MIATVDGIDGPLNRMTFNGYFLYNGFTMMNTAAITTINSGFVAYSHTSQLDGSTVPTMMRVKGNIASATNFYALCIFFDQFYFIKKLFRLCSNSFLYMISFVNKTEFIKNFDYRRTFRHRSRICRKLDINTDCRSLSKSF